MPGKEQTVAEHIVDFLERRDVKHVFGLCGHTNISVLAALAESPIDFVTVRHEQIASHAADAYARVQGKASVVLSHLSPGLTNCATGVANAALDCIPMVVIAGDIPTHYYGKHPHQEVNLHADAAQWEIYRPFVKRAWRVDRADLMAEILEKAFHLAESGQPGPVLVNVPMDIFSAVIPSNTFDRLAQNTRALKKPSIDDETAREIVEALARVLFPPGIFPVHGGDGHTAPLVDQVLAREVDPISATPFRYLLRSVQLGTLISRGRRFTDLGPDEAHSVVDVWSSGAVFPRRLMSDSLQVVIGMAFFRRPEVIDAIGWHQNCPMPPRSPDPRPGWTG